MRCRPPFFSKGVFRDPDGISGVLRDHKPVLLGISAVRGRGCLGQIRIVSAASIVTKWLKERAAGSDLAEQVRHRDFGAMLFDQSAPAILAFSVAFAASKPNHLMRKGPDR